MNTKLKNNLPLIFLILGGLLIIGGILVMIFGAGNSEGLIKVLFILISVVMILLGCVCIYFITTLPSKSQPNFFLYDTASGTNMPVESLTFKHVNKKMTYFMSHIASNAKEMWTEDIIGSDSDAFGEEDIFRPLAAYKMIYDLVDRASSTMWQFYLDASDDIIVSVEDALASCGDTELGKVLRQLHKNAAGDYTKTSTFLNNNKTYLQKKMMKYIKTNIDKF